MSLIEIHPEFSKVTAQLRRIADALETHLLYAYGHRSKSQVDGAGGGAGTRSDVSYSDNESTIRHDVDVALKRTSADPDDDAAENDEDENVFIS